MGPETLPTVHPRNMPVHFDILESVCKQINVTFTLLLTMRKYLWGPLGQGHCGRQQGTVLRVTCLSFCCLYVLLTTLVMQDDPRMPCHWAKDPLQFPALSLQGINCSDHALGPNVGPWAEESQWGQLWRNCAAWSVLPAGHRPLLLLFTAAATRGLLSQL